MSQYEMLGPGIAQKSNYESTLFDLSYRQAQHHDKFNPTAKVGYMTPTMETYGQKQIKNGKEGPMPTARSSRVELSDRLSSPKNLMPLIAPKPVPIKLQKVI